MNNQESKGDECMKKAKKFEKPSLIDFRLTPDWSGAYPLYQQAFNFYKQSKNFEKAKEACEKAAQCQEHLGSSWHAAKMLESGGIFAFNQQEYHNAIYFYTQAAQHYFDAGRAYAGSSALYKAAKGIEKEHPDESTELYLKAIDALELDESFTIGPNIYNAAIAHHIRIEKWQEAVELLLKYGNICNSKDLKASLARCYIGAVIICLYAEDVSQAIAVNNDCSNVNAYLGSPEYKAANELLDGYSMGDIDAIKNVINSHSCFEFLDASIARLAKKLPTGNLDELTYQMNNNDNLGHDDDLL